MVGGPEDRHWREVDHEKLVGTIDGERQFAWEQHHGNALLWKDIRGGAMWTYNYDDEDDHEEDKNYSFRSCACERVLQKNKIHQRH